MGDWRFNKDEEVELDGIGGVNILVKADVHRSGWSRLNRSSNEDADMQKGSTSLAMHLRIKRKRRASLKWRKELDIKWLGCRIMLSGISTPKRNKVI